jgi:hypothetical protein
MNETGDHHSEGNKPSSKSQLSHVFCLYVESRSKMVMTIMKMGHECKRTTGRVESVGEEGNKQRVPGVKRFQVYYI